jgi:glycosyltransferase involved in cell wall biosynthesis
LPALLSTNALSLRTAGRVLRAEGIPALRDRISDRLRERSRRQSFREVGSPLDLPPTPVLNLLTTAPIPRLGGLQVQLLHRIESEAERRPLALLYPEPGAYRLEVAADGRRLSLTFGGEASPSPVALTDPSFERAVSRAAAEVGARALHVEGLAGVPLASLLALRREGFQLILSVHDFSLFCPRPHLLEQPQLRFCDYSRERERCARCLVQDWPVPPAFQESRRQLARELLLGAAAVVYPSEFLRRRHLELFPGIPSERQRVIEPSGPAGGGPLPAIERQVHHVAYIGNVQPHKGALVFEEVVRRMPPEAYPGLRWSAYGGGDSDLLLHLRRLPRLKVRGYYRAGSLVELLQRDRVDLALLLSIVPESYSLALSECFAAGVPVVAFDHGAIAERVRRHGGGLLVEPGAGAAGIASVLAALASGLKLPPQPPCMPDDPPAATGDASAFEELYRELGLQRADWEHNREVAMSNANTFSYPARPQDRALTAAGEVERLARAALRHLRSGGLGQVGSALSRPWAMDAPVTDTEPLAELGGGAPVLYLPAVAWHYRFQRPQHLALALARAGHPVLYVDGFLRSRILPSRHLLHVQGGLHVLRMRVPGRPDPYREPLKRRAAARMTETILAGLRHERPLMVLVQLPFWAELGRELARRLGAPLVYDRIDLHVGFPGVPAGWIESVEARLIREADLVCATAGLLAERPREVSPRVLLLSNGVDLGAFPAPAGVREATGEVRVGYVGALGPWFDAEAVAEAARALPGWRFRLAGKVEDPDVAALAGLPNLETVGEIPFAEVPRFLAGLDVALVPFRDLPLTRAVDPVKLYEALAVGLPVVARRLPETERWGEPLVYLYDRPDEFVRQLRRAVAEHTPGLAWERRRAAESESWDHRAAELIQMVTDLGLGAQRHRRT